MTFAKSLKKYTLAMLLCPHLLQANAYGLLGGGSGAYGVLQSSTEGVTTLNIATGGADIYSVALNDKFIGLIGGIKNNNAYAALISPAGIVTLLNPLPPNSSISSVALNTSGFGLIGGAQDSNNNAYAAQVFPNGGVSSLLLSPLPNSQIISVAINSSGVGLLGGVQDSNQKAYAVRVLSNGSTTTLAVPTNGAQINGVAINSSGLGLIGGIQNTYADAYAAHVNSAGVVTALTVPTGGQITSVAINDSGAGIIGGAQNTSADAYAALVSSTGTVTSLSPLPTSIGIINSVAINTTGSGLIGGIANSNAYAALVSPGGVVQSLSSLPTNAQINSVAIVDSGAGLLGGQQNGKSYAALVTPTGSVIPIAVPIGGAFIRSVALDGLINFLVVIPETDINGSKLTGNNRIFKNYINKYASQDAFYFLPAAFDGSLAEALESAAPTRNAISLYTADNNLFYLNHSLSNHLRSASHFRMRPQAVSTPAVTTGLHEWKSEDHLVASLADAEPMEQTTPYCDTNNHRDRPYTLWFDGLGALSYQKAQKQTTAFNPSTGAAILGFDATINQKAWVGGGAAYAYTHIHEKKNAGHSDINQEYLFVYGSYQGCGFYADGALWGGLFQIDQVRNIHMTGFDFKSTSNPHGWQVAPHLELGYNAINNNKLVVDPFVMIDWVNAWQNSYKEKGSGPFNAGQKEHYSSLLRTEVGARFFETISFDTWRLTFQEKASYVYKKSFGVGSVNAFLVGSPGSFTVTTLTTPQNLGVGEFGMTFEPVNEKYPYGTIMYQGEFGSSSQSHQVSVELAWNF